MGPSPQRQRLQPLDEQPRVKRRRCRPQIPQQSGPDLEHVGHPRSHRLLVVPERLPEVHPVVGKIWFRYLRIPAGRLPIEVALLHHRAPDGGAVTPDHLGERVHGDVGSVVEGVEERRGRHRVVHDQGQLVPTRHLGDAGEVVHVALGVPDRLGVEQPGVLVDGPLEVGRVARVHEAGLDPEALQREAELGVGTAVELVPGHEVLPRGGYRRDGVEDGRLARRGGDRPRRPVDGRQTFLEHIGGGVHESGVDVPELLEREQPGGMLGVAEHVAGGLIDGHGPGQRVLIGNLAGMKGQRIDALSRFFTCCIYITY